MSDKLPAQPRIRTVLTQEEWVAIERAIGFVLAGEDPWESDNEDPNTMSDVWKACERVRDKLALRRAGRPR